MALLPLPPELDHHDPPPATMILPNWPGMAHFRTVIIRSTVNAVSGKTAQDDEPSSDAKQIDHYYTLVEQSDTLKPATALGRPSFHSLQTIELDKYRGPDQQPKSRTGYCSLIYWWR